MFSIISRTGKILYKANTLANLMPVWNSKYKTLPGYKLTYIIEETIDPNNKGVVLLSPIIPKRKNNHIKVNHLVQYSNIDEIMKRKENGI